jgi:hypothetical protein
MAAETSASSIAAYVELQSKQYENSSLREQRQDKMREIEAKVKMLNSQYDRYMQQAQCCTDNEEKMKAEQRAE